MTRIDLVVLAWFAIAVDGWAQQQPTGVPPVDSASVARESFAAGLRALRGGTIMEAKRNLNRSAAAWPMQPAYLYTAASLAARAGDTLAALGELEAYAALGLGRDLRADTAISRYLHLPGFATVARHHDSNRAPFRTSAVRATLADSTFWPEGVDQDPRTGNLYVTSVRHRTIAEIAADGRVRELFPRNTPGIGAVLAVRLDPKGG